MDKNNKLIKNVLVTGGLGYIGSHIVVELIKSNYRVIIVDNLFNSTENVLKNIKLILKKYNYQQEIIDGFLYFYNVDVAKQYHLLGEIFRNHKIDHVIHMASYKSVNESIEKPVMYYQNNLNCLLNLLELMNLFNVKNLIFSSSATVYGDSEPPFIEQSKTGDGLTNPYGKTKYFCEEILRDIKDMNIYLLRYFNPIGCHESGLIGDDPNGIPNNLMPYVLRVAIGEYDKLKVFGDNYNTKDGTPERDYIHVMDLANAHVIALNKISDSSGVSTYNVGTGKSTSVLELINVFEQVNNIHVNHEITNRRDGDVAVSYCKCDKIKSELGWEAKYSLEDMCKDSWNFIQQLNKNK